MRADLLDAKAAVDWAVAQLPVLTKRIIAWRQSKPYSIAVDTDSEPGKKLYRFVDIKPVDPLITAEAGAIIHSIRSSLDLLACTLAARNGHPGSTSTYFPIWKSAQDFADPRSEVLKKIKRLSQIDQDVIKDLRPYPGGNDLLCTLHKLDLTRKHRRLLSTFIAPRGIAFGGLGGDIELRGWDRFNEETVIVSSPATADDGDISVNLQVSLDEAGVAGHVDCTHPIREFARAATAIIDLFA